MFHTAGIMAEKAPPPVSTNGKFLTYGTRNMYSLPYLIGEAAVIGESGPSDNTDLHLDQVGYTTFHRYVVIL